MPYMVVTLEVSKLSGWLNADADCRESKEGHAVRGEVYGSARLKAVGQGTRGAHVEHPAHVHDLGRVEAERLVERLRGLPSRKAGMRYGKRYGPGA